MKAFFSQNKRLFITDSGSPRAGGIRHNNRGVKSFSLWISPLTSDRLLSFPGKFPEKSTARNILQNSGPPFGHHRRLSVSYKEHARRFHTMFLYKTRRRAISPPFVRRGDGEPVSAAVFGSTTPLSAHAEKAACSATAVCIMAAPTSFLCFLVPLSLYTKDVSNLFGSCQQFANFSGPAPADRPPSRFKGRQKAGQT
ncbi:MAG: hypothetical protein HFJ80_04575 [Clostridiales bacterium]|nr:hypothetical protein [Clostridiales bacterium]